MLRVTGAVQQSTPIPGGRKQSRRRNLVPADSVGGRADAGTAVGWFHGEAFQVTAAFPSVPGRGALGSHGQDVCPTPRAPPATWKASVEEVRPGCCGGGDGGSCFWETGGPGRPGCAPPLAGRCSGNACSGNGWKGGTRVVRREKGTAGRGAADAGRGFHVIAHF